MNCVGAEFGREMSRSENWKKTLASKEKIFFFPEEQSKENPRKEDQETKSQMQICRKGTR
jgi:hypothetical protein